MLNTVQRFEKPGSQKLEIILVPSLQYRNTIVEVPPLLT